MDQNQKPDAKRDREGHFGRGNTSGGWKKGESGNPSGRRNGDPRDRAEYQKFARRYSMLAPRRLAKLMEDPNVEKR